MTDVGKESNALAIFFEEHSGDIHVYDLIHVHENKSSHEEKFFYNPWSLKKFLTLQDWKQFFQKLVTYCPPNYVKSLVCETVIDPGNPTNAVFFKDVKEVAYDFGYENIHFISKLEMFLTSVLKSQELLTCYEINDYFLIGKFKSILQLTGQYYLLKKQKIGWDIVNYKEGIVEDFEIDGANYFTNDFSKKSGIERKDIKFVFFDIDPILEEKCEYSKIIQSIFYGVENFGCNTKENLDSVGMLKSKKYLSKVYSGEEYFNDYDCYVGNICEYKFELEMDEPTIELPIQFKRLPCTIKKTMEMKLAKNFKLIRNSNHSNSFCERTCLYDFDSNVENETVILTLSLDENHTIMFEIRKDDEQKTQIFNINPAIKFEKKCPTFIFGKDYCSVKYYKEGLQWNLKDINGNVKIPFKISFDKEIYIGDAALEHPEFLLVGIDLEMLINLGTNIILLNGNHRYEILLKCFEGQRKATTVTILAIFLKSILNLLQQNLNEKVEEIYWTAPNFYKQTMDKVFESLNIVAEFKNERVYPEQSLVMNWRDNSRLLSKYEQKKNFFQKKYNAFTQNDKKIREIRCILNKITPSTYNDLSVEFINKKVYEDLETLPTVVDLIFTKAVEEPTFVGIYSDLCRLQHEAESKQTGGKNFYGVVIRKCQQVFEGTQKTIAQQGIENIEEKLKTEEDPKKREALQEDLEELQGKQKRYMLGTVKFISHLFRIKLTTWRVVDYCLKSLLHSAKDGNNELPVECFLNLLESVGLFMKKQDELKELDQFFDYMVNFKSKVSNRVKFMIMDLEDLRNKGWKGKDVGPKTKEAVKAEVLKEEAQNKHDRDAYEVASLKQPNNERQSEPTTNGGKTSRDNSDECKTQAVMVVQPIRQETLCVNRLRPIP